MQPDNNQTESRFAPLHKVTPLSKYLALSLFIIMPFIGGWIGYTYAPEKVVEVERVTVIERPQPLIEKESVGTIEDYLDKVNIEGLPSDVSNMTKILLFENALLYVLRVLPMGEGLELKQVSWYATVPEKFVYVGGRYISDGTKIIFLGERTSSPALVTGADSASFKALLPNASSTNISTDTFGVDAKNLYHHASILEGIDPNGVDFLIDPAGFKLPIVFDEDTYWYPEGGCHDASYRIGTKDEMSEYVFPC